MAETITVHGTTYLEHDSIVLAIHRTNRTINYLKTLYSLMRPGAERMGVLDAIHIIDRQQWLIQRDTDLERKVR